MCIQRKIYVVGNGTDDKSLRFTSLYIPREKHEFFIFSTSYEKIVGQTVFSLCSTTSPEE